MTKRFTLIVGILLTLALLSGTFITGFFLGSGYESRKAASRINLTSDLDLVNDVYGIIKKYYFQKESRGKLLDGAVNGMIKSLDDPYTRRLKGDHFKFLEEQTIGKFSGVGIELGSVDSKIIVVSPMKDTPAERAGIKAKDIITDIDGKSTKDMPVQNAAKLIRGKEGTTVTLTILRDNEAPFDVRLTRQQIKVPNVSSRMIKDNIGYINVHQFSERTGDDVRKELDDLKSKGAKGIILDLRSNPGGLLDEAVTVTSNFIKSGKPIVSTKPRVGKGQARLATGEAGDTTTPLVVLVNKGSASASEIVAGAIQDYKRGVIVGEKTFGKGSVQSVLTLPDKSGLVITTAIYLTPKGRSLNKNGIKPDVVVKWKKTDHPSLKSDNQLQKAEDVIQDLIAGKRFKKAS